MLNEKILTNRPNSTTVEVVTVFCGRQWIHHPAFFLDPDPRGRPTGRFSNDRSFVATPKWPSRTSFESRSSGLSDEGPGFCVWQRRTTLKTMARDKVFIGLPAVNHGVNESSTLTTSTFRACGVLL